MLNHMCHSNDYIFIIYDSLQLITNTQKMLKGVVQAKDIAAINELRITQERRGK